MNMQNQETTVGITIFHKMTFSHYPLTDVVRIYSDNGIICFIFRDDTCTTLVNGEFVLRTNMRQYRRGSLANFIKVVREQGFLNREVLLFCISQKDYRCRLEPLVRATKRLMEFAYHSLLITPSEYATLSGVDMERAIKHIVFSNGC